VRIGFDSKPLYRVGACDGAPKIFFKISFSEFENFLDGKVTSNVIIKDPNWPVETFGIPSPRIRRRNPGQVGFDLSTATFRPSKWLKLVLNPIKAS